MTLLKKHCITNLNPGNAFSRTLFKKILNRNLRNLEDKNDVQ